MQPQVMSKAQFADHMGVSPGAVSKWLERGTITDAALIGEGRKAKINVVVAQEQVRRNRDIGQSLGNGIATRTVADEPPQDVRQPGFVLAQPVPVERVQVDTPDLSPRTDRVEDQLKQAKLEEQLRRNRMQAIAEEEQLGKLLSADAARTQMMRIADMEMKVFESALSDFADAMAARFSLPQRDVLHLLRGEFRKRRKSAAMTERSHMDATPKAVTLSVDLDNYD